MQKPVIEVKDLVTSFKTPFGPVRAVDGVSFSIQGGKTLGLVGESGCGKSLTSLSIMRLLPPPNCRVEAGSILLDGIDLLSLSSAEMEKRRGADVSMIFQEPMTALNPVFTVGDQIGEALEVHRGLKGKEKMDRVVDQLKLVGIPRPEHIAAEYPHQLSGGMRQRVMIAMALSCDPRLLIADEPTTALDVTIQIQILDLIRSLRERVGSAILFITHDLGVIAEMADQVGVMYLGKMVEYADVRDIFDNPAHPYTRGLMASRLSYRKKGDSLACIPGMVPPPSARPAGCAFAPRCGQCMDICRREAPELRNLGPSHQVRCWLYN